MRQKPLQLKTSLTVIVLLLAALTLAAVAVGWYDQQQTRAALAAMLSMASADAGRQALQSAAQGIDERYMQSRYVFAALIALVIALAVVARITMSRTILRPLKRVAACFDTIASGDLTQRIEVGSHDEIGVLYLAVKRLQDSLARTMGMVRTGIDEIASGSQKIVSGNVDLSSRTDQQAAALQQTSASMEQLASTVRQNADNARQANQLAATASQVAQRGGDAVGEVVATMEGISASSRKISDIVGVIDSIAFQTNILALNAAVEAARAGEQGRGFAVVASEVRALAHRSAQAAKEIKHLIDDSVSKVAEGSGQVERAGATMQEIVASVARVTDIMGEISAATTEQSAGIEQINLAVAQLDSVTHQNATLVEQASSSAGSLSEQVAQISQAVAVFKTPGNQVIDVAARQIKTAPKPAPAIRSAAAAQAPAKTMPTATLAQGAANGAGLAVKAGGSADAKPRQAGRNEAGSGAGSPAGNGFATAPVQARKDPGNARGPHAAAPASAVHGQKLSPLNPNAQSSEDEWVEF
jgi:methyl-accepting chemotaxis protein